MSRLASCVAALLTDAERAASLPRGRATSGTPGTGMFWAGAVRGARRQRYVPGRHSWNWRVTDTLGRMSAPASDHRHNIGGTNLRAAVVTAGPGPGRRAATDPSSVAALEGHHPGGVGTAPAPRGERGGTRGRRFITAEQDRVRFAPHLPWRDVTSATGCLDAGAAGRPGA